jgi:hypothetical protein
VAIALLLPLPALSVCGAPQPRLVRAEYFASPLVVEATLIKTRDIHDKDDPEGILARIYTLRVNKVMRGRLTEIITVYEGNDSGRASFYWVPKSEYLLFLFHVPEEKSWVLEGCGNSDLLSKSEPALQEITAIKAAQSDSKGLIEGMVSGDSLSSPIAGVRIEAHGATGIYAATTNDNGEFRFNVPPGRYVVRVIDNKNTYMAYALSYEDPRKLRIEPGGAVQVQFVQATSPPAR